MPTFRDGDEGEDDDDDNLEDEGGVGPLPEMPVLQPRPGYASDAQHALDGARVVERKKGAQATATHMPQGHTPRISFV